MILKDGVLVKLTLSTSAPFYGRTENHVYMIVNLVSIMRFVKVLGLKFPIYLVKQGAGIRDQVSDVRGQVSRVRPIEK